MEGVEDAVEGFDEVVADLSAGLLVDEDDYDVLLGVAGDGYFILLVGVVVFAAGGLVPHGVLHAL